MSLYRYDGKCQPYLGRRQQAPWEPGWSRFDKKRARPTSSDSGLGWTYANEHLQMHIMVCESHQTHRAYVAGSGQSTLKLDARGRELAAGAKTGEKPFRLRPGLGECIANHE